MKSLKLLVVGLGLISGFACAQTQTPGLTNTKSVLLRRDARVEIMRLGETLPIRLDVEVADEPAEQDRGLMNRSLSGDGEGMLFVYLIAKPRIFWMRDTPVPLDLLFFDSNRRLVAVIVNAAPFSDNLLKSNVPAQYVLEVRGGFVDRHRVGLGATLGFQ
jgi:uncharacterized membrane protein (UPF0127 family)